MLGLARFLKPKCKTIINNRRRHTRLQLEELEDRVVPTLLGQQLFPADYPWNQNIASAPVAAITPPDGLPRRMPAKRQTATPRALRSAITGASCLRSKRVTMAQKERMSFQDSGERESATNGHGQEERLLSKT